MSERASVGEMLSPLSDDPPPAEPKRRSGLKGGSVWTERQLLDRLRARLAGGDLVTRQWAFIEHVRAGAGWAGHTIDGLAVGLWSSTKHEIHAYEVKISRSDLLRELAQPHKAEVWTSWVDRFWLVAPREVIRDTDAIPEKWGILVPSTNGLRVSRSAAKLSEDDWRDEHGRIRPAELDRSRVAAILAAYHRREDRVS